MRTVRFLWIGVLSVVGLLSCTTNYYRIRTRIGSDDSFAREICATGDSAFMAGDRTHSPYWFALDSSWHVIRYDSCFVQNFFGEERKMNVCAVRDFKSERGVLPPIEGMGKYHVTQPVETLDKSFRWFYTYYDYRAVYPEITDKGPVPIDTYLTPQEQQIWFRSVEGAYRAMNGMELKSQLDDMEKNFWKWWIHTCFEISYDVVAYFDSLSGKSPYISCLAEVKDSLFRKYRNEGEDNFSPEDVCRYLDRYWNTSHYSDLYRIYGEEMSDRFDEKSATSLLFETCIRYEVVLPGRLCSTNAPFVEDDVPVWKVDAFRFFTGDYVLTAQSRQVNGWAFGVTLLLLSGVIVYCLNRLRRYRRK